MSRHHRAQKWSTHSPKLRALIEPQLPLPCVNCGRPVMREHKWQVGHRTDAMDGGKPVITNVGPVHCKSELWPRNCNQISGGRRGAAVSNRARVSKQQQAQDIRPW